MTGFELLAKLLPCAHGLAESRKGDDKARRLRNIVLLRQCLSVALKIAEQETGKPAAVLRKMPFTAVYKALPRSMMSDLVMLSQIVEKCGAKIVTKALYTYRPDDVYALVMLTGADMEQRMIDTYQCDILCAIAGAFGKEGSKIPTIHDLLEPKKAESKATEKTGEDILTGIIYNSLGGNAPTGGNDYEAV